MKTKAKNQLEFVCGVCGVCGVCVCVCVCDDRMGVRVVRGVSESWESIRNRIYIIF